MSEEEIKAIEELEKFINKYEPFVFYSKLKGDTAEINPHIRDYETYKTVLNLIEKQQKEIETLQADLHDMTLSNEHKKQNWIHKDCLNSYVSKDKIRELINERQFELQQAGLDFKDDIRLNTLQEIYYLNEEE